MKKPSVSSSILHLGFIAIVTSVILAGCKSRQEDKKSGQEEITAGEMDVKPEKEKLLKEISEYPIPTSFEVTKMLNEAGASYILSLSNPVDNVDKYITLKSKAVNLGIYGADLSYASTYNQTQETMQYLKASTRLMDDLQISSAFNKTMAARIEENLGNPDSLITIISDSFYDTYKYLQENEQDELSILVIAGSYIEALYITTQINIISRNKEQIKEIISDQEAPLNKMIEILEPVKDDSQIADIYNKMSNLHDIYEGAGEELTDEQIETITNEVEKVRNELVG